MQTAVCIKAMSATYVNLVHESPFQNVPSTPRLLVSSCRLDVDASPQAVVPEFVSQRSTPAPSPCINLIRCESLLWMPHCVHFS